jgi:hypothetical protein
VVVHKDDFVIDKIGIDSDPQAIEKETKTIEPAKGIAFDGMHDAMAFYQKYAQKNVFNVFNVKRTCSKVRK